MAYVPNYGGNWQTGAGGGTPITEAALDNLETQYAEAAADDVTHAALTTGVHGAGGNTIATDADITKEINEHPIAGNPMPSPSTGTDHAGVILTNATEHAMFEFKIPHDFTSVTTAVIVLYGGGVNRDIDWTCNADFGAVGESESIHSDSDTANGETVLANQLHDVDISAALTGLAAHDYVGMDFILDAITAGTVTVLQLSIKYS